MARPGWGSLFGCFGSSSHGRRKKAKGGGGKKKKSKQQKVAAAAGSSGSGRPRSLQSRMSFTELSLSGMVSPEDLSLSLVGSNLHVFTIAELRAVTRDFSMTNFIGEGGFGPVYKGFLDGRLRPGEIEPQHVAVKYLDADGPQGHREWLVRIRAHAGSGGSGRTYLQLHMYFYLNGSDTTHLLRTIDACCRPRWCTWGC